MGKEVSPQDRDTSQVKRRLSPVARAREGPLGRWPPRAKIRVGRTAREARIARPQGEIHLPAQPTSVGEG
jgi:hypothetical protein